MLAPIPSQHLESQSAIQGNPFRFSQAVNRSSAADLKFLQHCRKLVQELQIEKRR